MAGIYIKSIRLAATYDINHDPVLTIKWSMPDNYFEAPESAEKLKGVDVTVTARPSDTSILLPRQLMTCAELEDEIISAAWALGAFDMVRTERSPLYADDDPFDVKFGLASDFGWCGYTIAGQDLVMGDKSGKNAVIEAANDGYVTWLFFPMSLMSPYTKKIHNGKDNTLDNHYCRAGKSDIRMQKWYRPRDYATGHQHIYEFGKK